MQMTQEQHLSFLLGDPWNQRHFYASLTRHNHQETAWPLKIKPDRNSKFSPADYYNRHCGFGYLLSNMSPLINWVSNDLLYLFSTGMQLYQYWSLTPQYTTLWEIYRGVQQVIFFPPLNINSSNRSLQMWMWKTWLCTLKDVQSFCQ